MNRALTKVCVARVLSLNFLSLGGAAAAADAMSIDGRWSVVSVTFAGTLVPGLAGAELVLDGGKKTFTLPDGRVETGTYDLDASKQPAQLDSTTEGKNAREHGICTIDGDQLTLCIAAHGGPRPTEFAAATGSDRLLIVLHRTGATTAPAAAELDHPQPTGTRSFRMGFTGFAPSTALDAVVASRKFVRENGDILAHHIEGVPWAEALSGEPFPAAMLAEWEGKKLSTPAAGKVYLAISPGRGDLKLADKGGPLPKELVGRSYDDPLVKRAYLNYCRRAIEFFKPDYLAIGIEVNEIFRDGGPAKWNSYVVLHQYVYEELKKEHSELPLFASWTLHQMFQARGRMLEEFRELMRYNDIVAVSYYPFFVREDDRLVALDWMAEQFDEFQKPYAFVETNDAAERLPLRQANVVIEGTPEKQADYFARLLSMAQQRKFEFVISFIHQDYDALWEEIKLFAPELFIAWRDCGLLDEAGQARPAFQIWKNYFDLPLEK